ncbi:hypothetical protein RU639_002893 [Aspergillus parasiticus]
MLIVISRQRLLSLSPSKTTYLNIEGRKERNDTLRLFWVPNDRIFTIHTSAGPHRILSFYWPTSTSTWFVDSEIGNKTYGQDDETENSFTRPVDRAYVLNQHLSSYLYLCNRFSNGGRAPWISKSVGDTLFRGLFTYDQPEFGCYRITYLDDPS